MWFLLKGSYFKVTILLGFVVNGVFSGHDDSDIDDECIWEDRSFRGDKPPSVINAHTECSKGRMVWHYPYGGLRMSFHPVQVKGPFKLCFTSEDSGISVFQEGLMDLTLLKGSQASKTKEKTCTRTHKKELVLYIEASEEDEKMMKFDYSIVPLKKKHNHKPKECRPCRYDKLIKLICKSDFAIRGYINSSFAIPKTHFIQTDFVVQDLIHQKHNIFSESSEKQKHRKGLVRLPSGCSWGKGENKLLLVTGDIHSGQGAVMSCYTRDKEWLKLKKDYFKHLCNVFK